MHAEAIESIRSGDKRKMRRYLIDVGDERTLLAWDKSEMKSNEGKKR